MRVKAPNICLSLSKEGTGSVGSFCCCVDTDVTRCKCDEKVNAFTYSEILVIFNKPVKEIKRTTRVLVSVRSLCLADLDFNTIRPRDEQAAL